MRNQYGEFFISANSAESLKDKGYLAIDPHVHSSHSYDVPDSSKTSPMMIIGEQERKGLLKVITDHDTMAAHNSLSRDDVIKGVEMKIKPEKMRKARTSDPMHTIHINIYGLDDSQFNDLEDISQNTGDLDQFIDYIRSERLKYQYNHPFWHEHKERMNWKAIPGIAKNYFDVIELNAGRPKILNDLALYLAKEFDKGITSSTDTHTGRPGHAMVLAKGKCFDEMWESIKNRQMLVVRKDMTALDFMVETTRMIENIAENKLNKNYLYSPDTGITVLDNVARRAHKTGNNDMVGKIAYKSLCFFNNSFGAVLAERLYLRKQSKLGQDIAGNIMDVVYGSCS